ncbi:MAG: protein kinase [Planctomycetota bacterium]
MQGKRFGPYRIIRGLGTGATAVVYLAEVVEATSELPVGSEVALKVIHPHLMEAESFQPRVHREVEMGMSVRHPNVVRTLGYGSTEIDGETSHYIAMEHVEGQTLRELLEDEQGCDEPLCLHVGHEMAAGLAAVHQAGFIHRDVKPENVMITRDEVVKLMDLGMARLKDEVFRLSEPGDFVGTVLYSAPEQFLRGGEDVDGRADLYALGLILYELVTGDHALGSGGEPGAVMRRQIRTTPVPPSRRNPHLSSFFDELIMRLLRKDRSERFRSAAELAVAFEEGEESEWWRRSGSTRRRRPQRIRVPRETALYGRDPEIGVLGGMWDRACAGEGQVALIGGEAGIGKTRLVDEFVADLTRDTRNVNFLYGAYPPGGAATASGALSTAFRDHFGAEALDDALSRHLKASPDLAPRLAAWFRGEPLPGSGGDTGPTTVETLEGLFVRILKSIATDAPVVLCIDDLHFAPREARSIFAAISHGIVGDRVLVIGTYRPLLPEEWIASVERQPHVTRFRLGRLGARDLQLLLTDALLSDDSAEQLGGAIAVKSDGNPFFVFEILKSLKEREIITIAPTGIWERTGKLRDLVIPDSMKDLTRARIAELSEEERELLDVAACCGVSFDPVLVGEVLGHGRIPVLKRFTQLQRRHRLVHATGREFVFDHHQVREALYESLSELLREEYHAAIADVLIAAAGNAPPEETPGPATVEIVMHLLAARKGHVSRPWVLAAVENLADAHDFVTVLDIADRALAQTGLLVGEDRVGVLARKGHACQLLGRREEGLATWREGVEVSRGLSGPGPSAGLLVQYASFHTLLGAFRDALPVSREAVRVARASGSAAERARAWNALGTVMANLGHARAAAVQLTRALDLAREAEDRVTEAKAHATLAKSAPASSDEGREHHESAIRLFGETGRRLDQIVTLGDFGVWFLERGEFEEARRRFEEYRRLSRTIGYRRGELTAEVSLGSIHVATGRFEDARRCFEQDLRLNAEAGDADGEARARARLARVLTALGELTEAREILQAVLPVFDGIGDGVRAARALLDLARNSEALGDPELAAAQYERSVAALRKLDARVPLAEALAGFGRLELLRDNQAAAARCAEEARAQAGDAPLAAMLATALVARLPGGDAAPARAAFERHRERVDPVERMDVAHELWLATGDPGMLAAAATELASVVGSLPAARRDEVVAAVPLYRGVRAAT